MGYSGPTGIIYRILRRIFGRKKEEAAGYW
jgi:hypothetical protein